MKALDWYRSLAERERKTVLFGGIAAAVLLLAGGLSYLEAATSAAEARLASKRADLAWMQAAAPRLQSMPKSRGEPLPLVIDATALQAGLSSALSGSEPAGSGALRVRLQDASFDAMVVWLSRLQQERGLVVESASIDGTENVGRVNANLVFREP